VQLCPGLRLRRDRHARPLRRVGAAPRHENGEGCPRLRVDFGAQYPGLTAGCLRFVGWVAPPLHARLASGCWPSSAGWDFLPTGFHRKVSGVSPTSFPLSQASPGAISFTPPVKGALQQNAEKKEKARKGKERKRQQVRNGRTGRRPLSGKQGWSGTHSIISSLHSPRTACIALQQCNMQRCNDATMQRRGGARPGKRRASSTAGDLGNSRGPPRSCGQLGKGCE
jgi:hypothetical protein